MKLSKLPVACCLVLLSTLLLRAHPAAVCTVSLQPSASSPQLVGARIIWTATAANCGAAPVYQFSVAGPAEEEERDRSDHERSHQRFSMVRDFSLDSSFARAPMQEGGYRVRVIVKDGFDGAGATSTIVSATVNSRVTGDSAVVTPTLNPLVALYSAPPCEHGAVRVWFRPADSAADVEWTGTNALPCVPDLSRNFVVAGMLANTTYEMFHRVHNARHASMAPLLFTTGAPPASLSIPSFTVRQAPDPDADVRRGLVYHNLAARPAANAVNLLATDLSGRLEWY